MNKDGQRLWIVMSRHKGRKFFRQNPTVRQAPFCHQPHFYVGSQFSKYHFIALYPLVVATENGFPHFSLKIFIFFENHIEYFITTEVKAT